MNSKTQILLEYWGFHDQNVDKAWCLLEWIGWNSFEFEKVSCVSGYSFPDPCVFYARYYYALFGVTCVVLLTIRTLHVLPMHAILNLIHPYLS